VSLPRSKSRGRVERSSTDFVMPFGGRGRPPLHERWRVSTRCAGGCRWSLLSISFSCSAWVQRGRRDVLMVSRGRSAVLGHYELFGRFPVLAKNSQRGASGRFRKDLRLVFAISTCTRDWIASHVSSSMFPRTPESTWDTPRRWAIRLSCFLRGTSLRLALSFSP
jgi:hypothetical protein